MVDFFIVDLLQRSCYHFYMKKDLKFISEFIYPFAHAILLDDTQAKRLVADVLTRAMAEEIFDNNMLFYKWTFSIGHYKREKEIAPIEKYVGFYQLNAYQCAVLFLKHKTDFDFNEIAEILDLKVFEVKALLESARSMLASIHGVQWNLEEVRL